MTLFRPLALLLLLALAACATAREPASGPTFYVMRHLQKDAGSDPGLSAEGRANAERLAGWFGKVRPTAIFVSATRRARETAAPLAARLGIVPQEYQPLDVAGLVARAKAENGPVLIVGHSNTVPEIVAALGGEKPAPIAEEIFGQIWQIRGSPPRTEALQLDNPLSPAGRG
jgi:broad specificity phosphatase PhoE